MKAMQISRTGLDVEWRRLEVVAQNIANLNTTRGPDGQLFRPMRLMSGPASFSSHLTAAGQPAPAGVKVYGLEAEGAGIRRVYEPQHPDADKDGYVSYPDIDQAGSMTLMMRTQRAYEANLVAMNIARQMYGKALDLGKRG